MTRPDFMAIVGPTASGKTELSLLAGDVLGAEIISMDSRQIYRGMNIGTGKVGLKDRARLPHHGLDLRDPSERYSAGQFARDARDWVRDIHARGRVPLLVGGTGFFLRALMQPLFAEPELDPERLEGLREYLNDLSPPHLSDLAQQLDPIRFDEVGGEGRHRLTRLVEVALLTGRPLSEWHAKNTSDVDPMDGVVVHLDLPRELLYDRINRRVGAMIREGLVEEVKTLLEAGYGEDDPGMTGAGYREILGFIGGGSTLEEAADQIRQSHRRYARRQITWFRHQLPSESLTVDGERPASELALDLARIWTAACETSPKAGRP